ncbi:MAG TPA: N-formylglutamate amidohydrolase, partial [Hyphomicrobium sp.]|nr:N-formylglutamate amidohydrolase [Hyphomicrobium sp.]
DPELFADPLPDYANSRSVRVVGGLGTIARIVADGEEIYDTRLSVDEGLDRIEQLYFPFHDALQALIDQTKAQFGYAILVDCHSMPSAQMAQSSGPRPDFVLGDRFGAACDPRLTRYLRDTLIGEGYDVQLNRPYAGGYITEHYGRPYRGVQAVQIEINRALYLDEVRFKPSLRFHSLKRDLTRMSSMMFSAIPEILERRAAAE